MKLRKNRRKEERRRRRKRRVEGSKRGKKRCVPLTNSVNKNSAACAVPGSQNSMVASLQKAKNTSRIQVCT
jgi:hypothetical protein